jgi:hypothetical protein
MAATLSPQGDGHTEPGLQADWQFFFCFQALAAISESTDDFRRSPRSRFHSASKPEVELAADFPSSRRGR